MASPYLSALVLALAASASSCGDGSKEGGQADATATDVESDASLSPVSFERQIQPILTARCAKCHFVPDSPDDTPAPPPLTPDESYGALTGGGALACNPAVAYVAPGDPAKSGLYLLLSEPPPCGGAMPLNSGGLRSFAPKEAELIRRWIEEGAQKN